MNKDNASTEPTATENRKPSHVGLSDLLGGVPVLLWRTVRQGTNEIEAVRLIKLPSPPTTGMGLFVDCDQDPEEPRMLFFSDGANPVIVAACG